MVMNSKPLLLAPAMILGGCALMQPTEDPTAARLDQLERRMQAIERVVQNQSLVNMTQQVAAGERQGDEIQGRVETLEHDSATTADRQRQLYADLDARIQDLESSLSSRPAVGVMDGGRTTGGVVVIGSMLGGVTAGMGSLIFSLSFRSSMFCLANPLFRPPG